MAPYLLEVVCASSVGGHSSGGQGTGSQDSKSHKTHFWSGSGIVLDREAISPWSTHLWGAAYLNDGSTQQAWECHDPGELAWGPAVRRPGHDAEPSCREGKGRARTPSSVSRDAGTEGAASPRGLSTSRRPQAERTRLLGGPISP